MNSRYSEIRRQGELARSLGASEDDCPYGRMPTDWAGQPIPQPVDEEDERWREAGAAKREQWLDGYRATNSPQGE